MRLWQTNGGRLGSLKMFCSAPSRSCAAVCPAGSAWPRNSVFGAVSWLPSTATIWQLPTPHVPPATEGP